MWGLKRLDDISSKLDKIHPADIWITPFKEESNHNMIAPFLVLEAKASGAADDLRNIRRQTAYPIRVLAKLQHQLLGLVEESQSSCPTPLVWFVANRGQIWYVSALYMEDKSSDKYVRTFLPFVSSSCTDTK